MLFEVAKFQKSRKIKTDDSAVIFNVSKLCILIYVCDLHFMA